MKNPYGAIPIAEYHAANPPAGEINSSRTNSASQNAYGAIPVDQYHANTPSELATTPTLKQKAQNALRSGMPSLSLDLMRNLLAGMGKGGQEIHNTFSDKPTNVNMDETFGVTPQNRIGMVQDAGEIAPAMVVPPLRLAKYLPEMSNVTKGLLNYGTDIAQNAGLLGGMNAVEGKSPIEPAISGGVGTAVVNPLIQTFKSGNPIVRLGGAAALGGLGTMAAQNAVGNGDNKYVDAAGGLLAGAVGLRGSNAKDLAVMNLLKDVDLNRAMPRVQAAQRLGLKYLRPSEAMNSGYIGAIEGNVGITPETSLFLERQEEARKITEKDAIRNLYDTVFKDKDLSAQVSKLYKAAYESHVSPKFLDSLMKSERVTQAMQNVDSDPVFRDALRGVPKTSFAYLDQVKRELNDMATSAGHGTNRARLFKDAETNLVKRMDSINGTYQSARNLAQRQIVKNKMKESVSEEALKGTSFYNKNLKNDDKFDDLLSSLKDVPQAQQQATDMREVFKTMVDSAIKTPRSAVKLSETSMSAPRSGGQWVERFMHRLQGGAYDKAMAELMTDPKWFKEVARAKKMAEPNEKARFVANLVSRASGEKLSNIIQDQARIKGQ